MNYKVIGPPGTGKTKTLLEKVIEYKMQGRLWNVLVILLLQEKPHTKQETGF